VYVLFNTLSKLHLTAHLRVVEAVTTHFEKCEAIFPLDFFRRSRTGRSVLTWRRKLHLCSYRLWEACRWYHISRSTDEGTRQMDWCLATGK